MNLVDDATGRTLVLLAPEETMAAAMQVLKQWIERYGLPQALYVDLKTVYVLPKGNGQETTAPGFTHFQRTCERLGITLLKAYSPQAKGRVERKHAVFQDRFVKEPALQSITTLDGANALLTQGFLDALNAKFAKAPLSTQDGHRDPTPYGDLNRVFCWEYTRIVQNDYTLRFDNRHYQLEKTTPLTVRPKQAVQVCRHLDGTLTAWRQG